ncbi:very low-density lipoprotein receptor isoform X2 [Xenopus tropicalis]|uniref:Very low-density lipoprotein receptor isoform X2 n=1 Tax=Xenopus tropicalis TaxID=8364 RepID=A0A8J1J3G1_XENTR|nr:very low-density lipoprotein receptor isoform X2 [Xenopus tropicalis]
MEPDVYVVPVNDPYEQPTQSVYDKVMPCAPQVQPAPYEQPTDLVYQNEMPCTPQVQPTPYEQPTDPLYDKVMPCTPQMQPAPPPCSTQVPAGPPKGPFRWSLRKKILVPVGAVSISALVIVVVVLSWYFVTKNQSPSTSPSPCQMYCSYSAQCIYSNQICNGVQDCAYGDDERNCVTLTTTRTTTVTPRTTTPTTTSTTSSPICKLHCLSVFYYDTCVYSNQICDGIRQCLYGDDEQNCVTLTPTTTTTVTPRTTTATTTSTTSSPICKLYCISVFYYYTCVSTNQICDGIQQCLYGDDELNCVTLTTTRTTTATTRTTTATTRTTTATTTSTTSAPICKLYCTSLFYYYTCISTNQICDGIQQCLYGDDELNCVTLTTTTTTTATTRTTTSTTSVPICKLYCISVFYYDTCISTNQICDGIQQCLYGDDELNCATTTPSPCQMYCSYTYACIRAYQICNRVMDCLYGDDERNCASTTLSNPTCQMYCSYTYTCIRAYQICNGVMDCLYGDDERNCGKMSLILQTGEKV